MEGGEALGAGDSGGSVPMGASVEVLEGFFAGLEVSVDRNRWIIGRGRCADLMIADPTISRAHAAIGYAEGRFFVEDLGSTNGTQVNGSSSSHAELRDGDRIQMGKLWLRFRQPSSSTSGLDE